MKILITGGAGFIGSSIVKYIIKNTDDIVINIDKLTYSGNQDSLSEVESNENYFFEKIDICNRESLRKVFLKYRPDAVMHLAAESHVDRSIDDPSPFINTNIIGTFNLLEETRSYLDTLTADEKKIFRFHHISTDEVFGDLTLTEEPFNESTPYAPSSPYSASKASSDHLVRAWGRTYELPVIITNCSNNYGPFQHPEKLIPLMIINALQGKKLPIYGNGDNIRDWLFVEDHVKGLYMVLKKGVPTQDYNIGGNSEMRNLEVVEQICNILNMLIKKKPENVNNFKDLIVFVDERPGHDLRYAINSTKIMNDLSWSPEETFESGLYKTVEWYLDNKAWWQKILDNSDK